MLRKGLTTATFTPTGDASSRQLIRVEGVRAALLSSSVTDSVQLMAGPLYCQLCAVGRRVRNPRPSAFQTF